MLTNYFILFSCNTASYKPNKYSDFAKMKFYSDFQILGYNKSMAILDNLDDGYPLFESESFSGGIKDICCNGCNCQTSSDHNIEFIQDFIDFEQ